MWAVYNILFTIGYLLMMPRFIRRMCRRGGYGKGFSERFGRYTPRTLAKLGEKRRMWVHAVSVGEVFVALGVIKEIRSRNSDVGFVLTTNTPTGRAVAEARLADEDVLLYVPSDFPAIIRRALRAFSPVALVLVEGELWPNMLRLTRRAGVPVFLVNGRLTESSYRGYRKLRAFFGPALGCIDVCMVQTETDRSRLVDIGVEPGRVAVMGSAKYDGAAANPAAEAQAREALRKAGIPGEAHVLMGGSTWPGEEAALVAVYRALKPDYPALHLVLAPRHAERREEVATEIRQQGLRYVCRSRAEEVPQGGATDVMLVDTTGEMMGFYAAATIVFVGKSLTEHGGQNFIEPALLGKPVLTGPNLENFPVVAEDFRRGDALIQVADRPDMERHVRRLLEDEAARAALGKRARGIVESHRGVLPRTAERILASCRSSLEKA